MIFDKKKSVSVILSKVGSDGRRREAEVGHEGGDFDEYDSVAEDVISSVKDGSVKRLAAALRALNKMG